MMFKRIDFDACLLLQHSSTDQNKELLQPSKPKELILELLQIDNFLNIGLSAPTGKATARLKEALNDKEFYAFSLKKNKESNKIRIMLVH